MSDKYHYRNFDNSPHLSENDELLFNEPTTNRKLKMIVKQHQDVDKQGLPKTVWSLQGQTVLDKHPTKLLEKPIFESDQAPIVVLHDTAGKSVHTEDTVDSAIAKMNAQYPEYQYVSSETTEQHLQNKFANYPYKRVKSLTNSAKRPDMRYEIVEGEIIDPDLAKKVGTTHAYYLKALKDFTISTDDVDYAVEKGQVSGPMILSSNEKIAEDQLKSLRESANSRTFQNNKFNVKGQEQNFWLDKQSYLKGNWHVSDNGLLINTSVDIPAEKYSARSGFNIVNSSLHNCHITGKDGNLILMNSMLDETKIDITDNKMAMITDSSLQADSLSVTGSQSMIDSIVQNCNIKADTNLNDTTIYHPVNKKPLELGNTNMKHCNLNIKTNDADFSNKKWQNVNKTMDITDDIDLT